MFSKIRNLFGSSENDYEGDEEEIEQDQEEDRVLRAIDLLMRYSEEVQRR